MTNIIHVKPGEFLETLEFLRYHRARDGGLSRWDLEAHLERTSAYFAGDAHGMDAYMVHDETGVVYNKSWTLGQFSAPKIRVSRSGEVKIISPAVWLFDNPDADPDSKVIEVTGAYVDRHPDERELVIKMRDLMVYAVEQARENGADAVFLANRGNIGTEQREKLDALAQTYGAKSLLDLVGQQAFISIDGLSGHIAPASLGTSARDLTARLTDLAMMRFTYDRVGGFEFGGNNTFHGGHGGPYRVGRVPRG